MLSRKVSWDLSNRNQSGIFPFICGSKFPSQQLYFLVNFSPVFYIRWKNIFYILMCVRVFICTRTSIYVKIENLDYRVYNILHYHVLKNNMQSPFHKFSKEMSFYGILFNLQPRQISRSLFPVKNLNIILRTFSRLLWESNLSSWTGA